MASPGTITAQNPRKVLAHYREGEPQFLWRIADKIIHVRVVGCPRTPELEILPDAIKEHASSTQHEGQEGLHDGEAMGPVIQVSRGGRSQEQGDSDKREGPALSLSEVEVILCTETRRLFTPTSTKSTIDGEAAPELRGAWIAMIRLGAPRRLEIALVGARYGTLEELAAAGLLDPALEGGALGYAFAVHVDPAAPGERWMAVAVPGPALAGAEPPARHLALTGDGVVFAAEEPFERPEACRVPPRAVPLAASCAGCGEPVEGAWRRCVGAHAPGELLLHPGCACRAHPEAGVAPEGSGD